jgi:hypothetical protein
MLLLTPSQDGVVANEPTSERTVNFVCFQDSETRNIGTFSDRGAAPKGPDNFRLAKNRTMRFPTQPGDKCSQLSTGSLMLSKNASSVTKTEHEFPVPQATLVMPARNNELPRTIGAKSRKAGMKSARDKKV